MMQIFYISARPDVLPETLAHVEHFAPFITSVVVGTPSALLDDMTTKLSSVGLPVTVLTDEELTGMSAGEVAAMDHTTRNYFLRARAVSHKALDDVFIMSDDDNRPLIPIDQSTFIDDEGRHRRYYFHSLASWRHDDTTYDRGLQHSWILLRQLGFSDPLAYASHQPQIIDKAKFAEVSDSISHLADRYTPDEWSPYFTIAADRYPDVFADPEPFTVLGWPRHPGEFAHEVTPPIHQFENFYPELHDEGGMYAGLPTHCDPETIELDNLEKIFRWTRLDRDVRELRFPSDIDQPWTTDNIPRSVAFGALRKLRGAYRYLTLAERAQLAELEGRMRRFEQNEKSAE